MKDERASRSSSTCLIPPVSFRYHSNMNIMVKKHMIKMQTPRNSMKSVKLISSKAWAMLIYEKGCKEGVYIRFGASPTIVTAPPILLNIN